MTIEIIPIVLRNIGTKLGRRHRIPLLQRRPLLLQLGKCTGFWNGTRLRHVAWKYLAIQSISLKRNPGAKAKYPLTNSTNLAAHQHQVSHPDRSINLKRSCKSVRNLWWCQSYRRPTRTRARSGATISSIL